MPPLFQDELASKKEAKQIQAKKNTSSSSTAERRQTVSEQGREESSVRRRGERPGPHHRAARPLFPQYPCPKEKCVFFVIGIDSEF